MFAKYGSIFFIINNHLIALHFPSHGISKIHNKMMNLKLKFGQVNTFFILLFFHNFYLGMQFPLAVTSLSVFLMVTYFVIG